MGEYPNKSKKSASMTGKKKVMPGNAGHNGFTAGGKGHMFGKQHAGPKKAGVTGDTETSDGGKFAKGGNGKMFGLQHAGKKAPGVTGKVTKGK